MNSHRMVGALIVCCILVGYIVLESRLFFLSLCPVGTLAAPWFRCVGSSSPGATQASPPHIHTSPAPTGLVYAHSGLVYAHSGLVLLVLYTFGKYMYTPNTSTGNWGSTW